MLQQFIKYVFLIGFIFSCFSSAQAQKETSQQLNLSGTWSFKIDPNDIGEERAWFATNVNSEQWDSMSVPGNWDLRNEYAHYAGMAWYKKTVNVPQEWKGKLIRLLFESVYHDSKVWVNGKLLGENHNGYMPFEFDVSKNINYGDENVITICADNRFRRGALWNWGGIRRPVRLIASEGTRIVRQHITAMPDLKKGSANVQVKLFFENAAAGDKTVSGHVEVKSPDQKRVALLPYRINLKGGAKGDIQVATTLSKKDVRLWHFDAPHLYSSTATINDNSTTVTDRFGIRKLEVDGLTLKLNGEVIRPMGYNLVPDDRTTGNTLPTWRIKEDIDLLKSLGANFTRLSHLPLPEEMLDYLDERGIMILEEIPLWGYDQLVDPAHPLPKEWLTQLVTEHYNHPSIVGWSVGNEIGNNAKVMEYVGGAIEYLKKELDSTRLGVMISHTPYAAGRTDDPLRLSDLGLFNAYNGNLAFGKNADTVHKRFPDKSLFYSEFGHQLLSEDPNKSLLDIGDMLNSMRGKPYLIGASLWTFNDYRSSFYSAAPTWSTKASENRDWGIVNVFRQPKKLFRDFQREYSPVKTLEATASNGKLLLKVQPRTILDLPAYSIHDYKIIWQSIKQDGTTKSGAFWRLPSLKPGDALVQKDFDYDISDVDRIHVQLVSPLHYTVQDTTIYLSKPATPKIKEVIKGQEAVRVVFDRDASAKEWKVIYGEKELNSSSDTSINHFIDVTGLKLGATYDFALVAINDKGESEPSDKVSATLDAHIKINRPGTLLPPIIWQVEPTVNGVFIGYTTQPDGYLYQFDISTTPDLAKSKRYVVQTKGVSLLSNLANGQQYYGRMRSVRQTLEESAWSEVFSFRSSNDVVPASPKIHAVIKEGAEAIILFDPVFQATGYQLQYRSIGSEDWSTENIAPVKIYSYSIKHLDKNKKYEYRLAAINEAGMSGYFKTSDLK